MMICGNCQTTLPDEAVACWKCGLPTKGRASTPSGAPTAGRTSTAPPDAPPSSAASQPSVVPPISTPSSLAPSIAPQIPLAPQLPVPEPLSPAPAQSSLAAAPGQKGAHDLLLFIVTFVGNAAFFICAGWSVPFAIWGNILSVAKQNPEWANVIDVVSGVALVISGLVFFLGCWLGSYWVILRLINPSPVPESR